MNQTVHMNTVKNNQRYSRYIRALKLFSIDLLIDGLEGVGLECNQQGSEYTIVQPNDRGWVQTIMSLVG